MRVVPFEEAIGQAGNPAKRHLLLGNGFSIAVKPDIFTYGSLRSKADLTAVPHVNQLFDVLGTQDFEAVIKHLIDAARVIGIYRPEENELIRALEDDAVLVKEALVTVIGRHHPDRPQAISDNQYKACRSFLADFDHIYTLNYDVILYWALMHRDVDDLQIQSEDGFRHPEDDPDAPWVTWQQSNKSTVHFVHGALHLFDSGPEILKYTWSKTSVPLVDQIRDALDKGRYPIFVAEGDSDAKLDKIMHSDYLHKALRSIEACADNGRACFVVFGHSLADNDRHVLRLIGRGKVPYLLVSVYGDPNSEENRLKERNARHLISYRSSINARYPLEVFFYDAASAHVWG